MLVLIERVVTLSAEVEVMKAILADGGLVLSPFVIEEKVESLRHGWNLPEHPHQALSEPSSAEKAVELLARVLGADAAT